MPETIVIQKLWRERGIKSEALEFVPGVNLITGPNNTGKTKWLETLDYLFGDEVSVAERAEDEIFKKYSSAGIEMAVAEKPLRVERRWGQSGIVSKVLVNEQPVALNEYRDLLMKMLSLPIVHYPQGNPYSPRSWPELGWRSLYRHIYRRQHFWTDIADKQPQSEQHAVILEFLGVAELMFSGEYSRMVQGQKKIIEMQSQKKSYLDVLNDVTQEILSEENASISEEAIGAAISKLQNRIFEIRARREEALANLTDQATPLTKGTDAQRTASSLSAELIERRSEYADVSEAISKSAKKLTELKDYQLLLQQEVDRLKRASSAGQILSELKVTHCPACDQALHQDHADPNNCFLCHQPLGTENQEVRSSAKRIEFEIEQIESEIDENKELEAGLEEEIRLLQKKQFDLHLDEERIDTEMAPLRSVAATILPPEISIYDTDIGRLDEQIRQLERVKRSLSFPEILESKIAGEEEKVSALVVPVEELRDKIDFGILAGRLEQGLNAYFAKINELKPQAWSQKPVAVRLSEKSFSFRIDGQKWQDRLGGTLRLYFLLAYHYSILSLTSSGRYPGLAIIDFPAELQDHISIADNENFLIQPFIDLLQDKSDSQLIVAGSAFQDLEVQNRIELSRVWS